jgi:hypothetical protein
LTVLGSLMSVTGPTLVFFEALLGSGTNGGIYHVIAVTGGVMLGTGIGLAIGARRHSWRLKAIKEELEYRGIQPSRASPVHK